MAWLHQDLLLALTLVGEMIDNLLAIAMMYTLKQLETKEPLKLGFSTSYSFWIQWLANSLAKPVCEVSNINKVHIQKSWYKCYKSKNLFMRGFYINSLLLKEECWMMGEALLHCKHLDKAISPSEDISLYFCLNRNWQLVVSSQILSLCSPSRFHQGCYWSCNSTFRADSLKWPHTAHFEAV